MKIQNQEFRVLVLGKQIGFVCEPVAGGARAYSVSGLTGGHRGATTEEAVEKLLYERVMATRERYVRQCRDLENMRRSGIKLEEVQ